jgi:hypothetical protein
MTCIIKLHGTSGSGKTTAARGLMPPSHTQPIPGRTGRPEAYKVLHPELKQPLYVLGPYTVKCGGLDSVGDAKEHIVLLNRYAPLGHVLYEGLLGSEYYGGIGKASEQYGDRHIFAFLDTPIAECVKRVVARRLEAGNEKLFDPTNTVKRVSKIDRLKWKLQHELKREVVSLNYLTPVAQLLSIFQAHDHE